MLLVIYQGHCIKKITKSKHPIEEELLLCLDDMVQSETTCTETDESEDWVRGLNHGGLIYVTSEMYQVICAMEMELRPHLQSDLSQLTHFKQNALESIMVNEDVLFFWSILSAWEVATNIEEQLLRHGCEFVNHH